MSNSTTIYSGNFFDIDSAGGDWTIWRIVDDEGNREQIILTQEAMDDLADYFTYHYMSDRAAASRKNVAEREP